MSRSATAGFLTALAKSSTRLARLWHLTRLDGVEHFFTTHDRALVFGGDSYSPLEGFSISAVETAIDFSVDNATLLAFLNSAAMELAVRNGRLDGAEVKIHIVHWDNIGLGDIKFISGTIGNVRLTDKGIYEAEFRSLMQKYAQPIGGFYQVPCETNLGSAWCRIPIAPPEVQSSAQYDLPLDPGAQNPVDAIAGLGYSFVRARDISTGADPLIPDWQDAIYEVTVAGLTDTGSQPAFDPTPGATTVWGSATFTAREAWQRAITVTALDPTEPRRIFYVAELTPAAPATGDVTPGRHYFPDDCMNGGAVLWVTGDNAGAPAAEVKNFVGDTGTIIEQEISLFLPMPYAIQVGDTALIYRGCDYTRASCRDIFGNLVNHRGFPDIPGSRYLFRYPDARR